MRNREQRRARSSELMLPPSLMGTLRAASPVRDRPPPTATRVLSPEPSGGGSATIVFADPLDEDATTAGPQTTDTPARLPLTLGETTVVRLSAGVRVDAVQFDAVLTGVRASMWLVDHATDTEYRSGSGYAPAHSGSTHGSPPHVRLTVPFVWTGELAAGTYSFGMRVETDTDGGTSAPITLAELWLDAIY